VTYVDDLTTAGETTGSYFPVTNRVNDLQYIIICHDSLFEMSQVIRLTIIHSQCEVKEQKQEQEDSTWT